jgi:MSHA pilin protein MshC
MCLDSSQIEVVKSEIKHYLFVRVDSWLLGSRDGIGQGGFSLIELIMVMVIVGILAVVVAPRFFDANVFKSRGFADQIQSALRYAQKEAVAQHRMVCVALASTSLSLTIANTSAAVTCTPSLLLPAGGSSITAPSGVTMTFTSANFTFDALGRTAAAQTITISGATNSIIVEAETGYVHSP